MKKVIIALMVLVGIAPMASGAVELWSNASSPSTTDVSQYQRFDAEGAPVWPSLGVLPGSFGSGKGVVQGPDGGMYVTFTSGGQGGIMRFNPDGSNGTVFVPLNTGGLTLPGDIEFGPDGDLYVAGNHQVRRFDGTTGQTKGVGATLGDGNALVALTTNAEGVAFSSDGSLFVSNTGNGVINKFNPATGASLGSVGTGKALLIDIDGGADGRIYFAALIENQVLSIAPDLTGQSLFVTTSAFARYLVQDPRNNNWLVGIQTNQIYGFSAGGTPLGLYATAQGNSGGAWGLAFTPEPASLALLGLGGLMMLRRRRD